MRLHDCGNAEQAVASIYARRVAAGDRHLDTLPDDPAGVVAWVCAHQKAPASVLAADILDALALVGAVRVTLDRQEHTLLRAARKAGVTWQQIARVMRLRSRQAAEQRARRLDAWHAGEGRSERAARARRAGEAAEAKWLLRHRDEIRAVASALVVEFPDEAAELAEALGDPAATVREIVGWMSVVLADLDPAAAQTGFRLAAGRLVSGWRRARGG
jgi:hypothetical protein